MPLYSGSENDVKILEEGSTGVALAPKRGKVPVVFGYQDLTLESGLVVRDVLVGVDVVTGEVLSLPARSTPRIKLARQASIRR